MTDTSSRAPDTPPRVRVAGAADRADAFAGARDDTSAPTSAERDEDAEKSEKPPRSHAASVGGRRGTALPPRPGQLQRSERER